MCLTALQKKEIGTVEDGPRLTIFITTWNWFFICLFTLFAFFIFAINNTPCVLHYPLTKFKKPRLVAERQCDLYKNNSNLKENLSYVRCMLRNFQNIKSNIICLTYHKLSNTWTAKKTVNWVAVIQILSKTDCLGKKYKRNT